MTKHAWGLGLFLCGAVLCGCGDDDAPLVPDAGPWDAGRSDAGAVDAGAPEDAGSDDAGEEDGGALEDAGSMDAGADDAGADDAGADDAGADDAGTGDAGTSDAGTSDAGTSDAGSADAGGATGTTPGPGDLVIVEIQGNPQVATDEQAEYIELLNVSGRELDLRGVRLAHREWSGGEPVASVGAHTIATSVIVAPGARVLLARSSGGYFGGATRDYVYGGFVFANGGTVANRLRVMVPSWDGSEPPAAGDVIDEVRTPPGAFDNPLRGRALQLDPDAVPSPTAAGNDDPADWCHAAATAALEYRTDNWGTPRATNRCD